MQRTSPLHHAEQGVVLPLVDDLDFWDRVRDICALYRCPPEGAIVLSIDEKTAIQARERRYPSQPARPGRRARREFEYRRHGTVSIVAALLWYGAGVIP
ncbi:hypothetical protein [Streptomyces sp. NBC_01589]|uniref:hypothetical protein n=1 Tax=unclassified Streptomyces TaxID=2593676 RepID=UPI00386D3FF8